VKWTAELNDSDIGRRLATESVASSVRLTEMVELAERCSGRQQQFGESADDN